MGENLEKVFNAGVNRYIMFSNSSEGEDVTENSDFTEVVGSHKKKKGEGENELTVKVLKMLIKKTSGSYHP